MEIKSRLKEWAKDKPSVVVQYPLPEDHKGLVDMFGEQVVASKAVDSLVIDIQALVRRLLKAKENYTPEQIQKKVDEYKPSATSVVRRSPAEKIGDLLGKMTAEEKAALLAQLKG